MKLQNLYSANAFFDRIGNRLYLQSGSVGKKLICSCSRKLRRFRTHDLKIAGLVSEMHDVDEGRGMFGESRMLIKTGI